jgi:hypothetical protein
MNAPTNPPTRKNLLSICIPTFNRKDIAVAQLVHIIANHASLNNCKVIFSDNNSDDCTYDNLLQVKSNNLAKADNIIITQNVSGGGFYGNIVNLIYLANTEYLVFLSDEDRLNIHSFRLLQDWIENSRELNPLFISAQRTTKIVITGTCDNAWDASSYISGLVFNVAAIKDAIHDCKPDNISRQSYPHVYSAFTCILKQKNLFLAPIIYEKGKESTVRTFSYIKGLGPRLLILGYLLDWLESRKITLDSRRREICIDLQLSVSKKINSWAVRGSLKYGRRVYEWFSNNLSST